MTTEDLAGRPASRSSGRAILFIGLALGIVTAVLLAVILSGDDDGGSDSQSSAPATRIAVIASEDIPARTRLTRDMLEVKTFNVSDIDPEAFSAVSQITNRVTSQELVAGQVVVPELVSVTTGEGLTFALEEGMRAISIGVSEVVIAGGNLAPGNYVDIIGIFDLTADSDPSSIVEVFTGEPFNAPVFVPEESTLTFTILQNVKVLAVAQKLTPETSDPGADENDVTPIIVFKD
jgi:pilus assembly protein CpaB